MGEEVKVLRTWSSPYALRVVQALKVKGIEFEPVFEDFGKGKSDALLEVNPVHKKVPVLVHNGKPVCESLVILEYIDEMWKQCPLLPRDPYERARARFWANFGDDKLVSSIRNVFIAQPNDEEEAIVQATGNLKFLEEQLKLKGTKFFGGETIGYLDIALGWMAYLISVLQEIAGLKLVDVEAFPLLSAWMDSFADDPVIKETLPPHDRMVEKFKALREAHRSKS